MAGYNSIDAQLSNLSLNESVLSLKSPTLLRKKRPARAYHILSPQLDGLDVSVNNVSVGGSQTSLITPSQTFQSHGQPYGSTPASPVSPPAPSMLQFQYQTEVQQAGKNLGKRTVSRDITSEIPDRLGKPYHPDAVLSVPDQRAYFQQEFWSNDFLTFQNACPPLATTDFKAVDQGTASPKYMSLSLYSVPASDHLRTAAKLPVALNVRPFAVTGDEPVPEVDFLTGSGPLRCNRCRAYINSTVQFTHSNKFICNLCQFANPIPEEYACPLDAQFRRVDHAQRPELNKGVVDFVLPPEYWEKPELKPVELHQVFLVDVSVQAIQRDIPRLTADAIRASLYSWNDAGEEVCILPAGSKVALISFDKHVQFYNLSSTLQQPSVTVVSDLEDPFIPFHDGLFVDPIESKFIIDETLTLIESTNKFNRSSEVSYGAALCAAATAIAEVTLQGGKITCALSTIPNFGPGSLSVKKYEDAGLSKDHEKEKLVLEANSGYYKDLKKRFVEWNIGLDLFAFPSFDMDLVNTAYVTSHTGGVLKIYSNFNAVRDERKFVFEFKKAIGDTVGYQGHLKVRCSSGLQVQEYYGNFSDNAAGPLIPVLHRNSNFDVLFSYDGKLNTSLDCHFQAALLYTTVSGVRKVRVVNLVAAVTDRLVDVFSFVNQDVLLNLMIRDCIKHIPGQSLAAIKELIDTKLVSIFSQYRQYIASRQALPSQLIVPESLKTLASFLLSFEKSRLLKKITSLTKNNLRIYNQHNLYNLPLALTSYYLYPYIVALHSLDDDDCEYNEIYLKYNMPKGVTAALSSIEVGGCYFAFNGERIIIWIHKDVNTLLVEDLFGVKSVNDIDPLMDELPLLDTHISKQVQNLVAYFAKKVCNIEFLPVKILRFGIDDQQEFLELFIEDKSMDGIFSYGEYLSSIHKQIRERNEKLTKGPKTDFFQKFGGLVT